MPAQKDAGNKEAAAGKRLTRRDFLVAGGTVAAVDALIAATPASAIAPAAGTEVPESRGYSYMTAGSAPVARPAC